MNDGLFRFVCIVGLEHYFDISVVGHESSDLANGAETIAAPLRRGLFNE